MDYFKNKFAMQNLSLNSILKILKEFKKVILLFMLQIMVVINLFLCTYLTQQNSKQLLCDRSMFTYFFLSVYNFGAYFRFVIPLFSLEN